MSKLSWLKHLCSFLKEILRNFKPKSLTGIEKFRYYEWKSNPRRKKINSPIFLSTLQETYFLL